MKLELRIFKCSSSEWDEGALPHSTYGGMWVVLEPVELTSLCTQPYGECKRAEDVQGAAGHVP